MIKLAMLSTFLTVSTLGALSMSEGSHTRPTVIQAPEGVQYIVPASSPVRFDHLGKHGTAYFSGTLYLTGKYTYGYVTDNPEADATYGRLFLDFEISKKEAQMLPYWKTVGPIRNVYIRNNAQFIRKVVGSRQLSKLKGNKIRKITGTITIKVDKLKVWVECDAPHVSVKFLSIKHSSGKHTASTLARYVPC